MNGTTKMQLEIIMRRVGKMKQEKIELTADNLSLQEACNSLRERLTKSDEQRHALIKMFSRKVMQHQANMRSVQRENDNLLNTIQEQSLQIKEHVNTIEKLKEEIDKLKKEKEAQRKYTIQQLAKPRTNSGKKDKVANQTQGSFKHPSFEEEEAEPVKYRRKVKSLPHFRWANLDIQINGVTIKKEISDCSDTDTKLKLPKDKKRKLYCPDDATVDLTTEED